MARTPDAEIALIERVCSGETQLPFHEVFVMRDIQNLSIAETAEVLQISQALVKQWSPALHTISRVYQTYE
jgi:DNA-directed RNA polymerase specialized sigma24 family protein